MILELRPLKTACNLACKYCYQNMLRDKGNVDEPYCMTTLMASLKKENIPFAMFGGEPLLIPDRDLEEFLSFGFERYKCNTIQTNGTLINDNHFRMFRQYNVHVGISIDGPGACNDLRWAGTLEKTREATARTENVIQRLCQENIPICLIITLHRKNAVRSKLPIMRDWLLGLAHNGLHQIRLHILETDDHELREKYALSPEENVEAMLFFADVAEELGPRFFIDVFHDITSSLLGNDNRASCVWRACDFYNSASVGILGENGEIINCGHTHNNKDGIEFLKAEKRGYERYITLYHTPQEHGGCSGCRFFLICKGGCPASAMNGDWRNRTMYCTTWKKLCMHFEDRMIARGKTPVSIHSNRKDIERKMLSAWAIGQNPTVKSIQENMIQ